MKPVIRSEPAQGFHRRRRRVLLLLPALLASCAAPQLHNSTEVQQLHLDSQSLRSYGIAFITPSSVTGQEEDKQGMALSFVKVLRTARPDTRVVNLPETLSAVNAAGLALEYRRMFEDYKVTGIFDRDILGKVARVNGVRYIAHLKLAAFKQESKGRWGTLGLRIVETKVTVLRLFLQIWDSHDGSIAWEANEELTFAHEAMDEGAVGFNQAMEYAAHYLIARLP